MKTLIAKDGYRFVNKDKTEVRSTFMIVPDGFDDYVEVTEEEAIAINEKNDNRRVD